MYLFYISCKYIVTVKFATCFGYSNHHQVDISVHEHDTFSATLWDPILFTFAV